MEFNGNEYSIEMRPASRPADYQMNIYAPEVVKKADLPTTVVMANVFNGSSRWKVSLRVDRQGKWSPMEQTNVRDPAFVAEKASEESLKDRTWIDLPGAHSTPHMWRGMLPTKLSAGTHIIEVRGIAPSGKQVIDHRILRVETQP